MRGQSPSLGLGQNFVHEVLDAEFEDSRNQEFLHGKIGYQYRLCATPSVLCESFPFLFELLKWKKEAHEDCILCEFV